jgi:LmbE family N-acetylglucosaminyl deacetylase
MTQIPRSGSKPRVLVVVAHPDDESFGLGAVILWLGRQSVPVSALLFTQGEASTLGNTGSKGELSNRRRQELACASKVLGLVRYDLYSYADGHLAEVPLEERERQWQAIRCHQSQASEFSVVRVRLELLRSLEYLVESYRGNRGSEPFWGSHQQSKHVWHAAGPCC